jgi:hypothetical protein
MDATAHPCGRRHTFFHAPFTDERVCLLHSLPLLPPSSSLLQSLSSKQAEPSSLFGCNGEPQDLPPVEAALSGAGSLGTAPYPRWTLHSALPCPCLALWPTTAWFEAACFVCFVASDSETAEDILKIEHWHDVH